MKQNISTLILENEVIMLDTSVAMDDNFEKLVAVLEMPLMESRKKIIVKNAVWAELLRHLDSRDVVKRQRATTAVQIIGMHYNIFDIDDSDVNSEKIIRAFADVEFLADLMLHKNRYSQALLTNDKKLSKDVVKLNEQESCFGKQISVYNLNDSGDIILYSYEATEERSEKVEYKKTLIKEERNDRSNIIPILGSSTAALVVGVIIGKYGKEIINGIKSVA